MRRTFIVLFTGILFATPLLASASALSDRMDQARFFLNRSAAIAANFDTSQPACVATTTLATVLVGTPFLLAWGSFGPIDQNNPKNQWTQSGAFMVVLDKAATYTYTFDFYAPSGAKFFCKTKVIVE